MGRQELTDIEEKIDNMMELHQDGEIFVPTFKPEVKYSSLNEKVIAKRKMRQLRTFFKPKVKTSKC